MGRSKKTRTTQGDLQKGSPSDWWDDITITQEGIEAYLMWIENRDSTHEGLGEYRGAGKQEDECDRQ